MDLRERGVPLLNPGVLFEFFGLGLWLWLWVWLRFD